MTFFAQVLSDIPGHRIGGEEYKSKHLASEASDRMRLQSRPILCQGTQHIEGSPSSMNAAVRVLFVLGLMKVLDPQQVSKEKSCSEGLGPYMV